MAPSPPDLALRDLRPDDDAFLYRVYAGTRLEELAPLGWGDAQQDAFLRMQHEAQRTDYWRNYDTTRFQVVTCDGRDVGRLYVERRPGALDIIDIALLPEHRGRGIGTRLLDALAREADAHALTMRIHVEHANPAQHLYLRHGFEFHGDAGPIYRLMERRPRAQHAERAA
ncbi:ribosomal protein S18 acetylase RimI-like enzyme [Dokdonella fugitiva]|uniref:Ribosomal protein S18 acetylase RimI-like enzyme n=1 Tax=Dokdonella fugitiva TaxID=328517 RepID=A0A839ERB0_9GAMM|nr:GNAT family N-acetyltransferase [Dokdonella fugitiva]MBA8886907.1 ribosomal protein S18 acetylase RimI-like enzyme [Dokdonella fugitiva]